MNGDWRAMGMGTGTGLAGRGVGGTDRALRRTVRCGAANGSRGSGSSVVRVVSSSVSSRGSPGKRASCGRETESVPVRRRGPQPRWFGSCRRALVGSAYRGAMRPFGVWRLAGPFPWRLRGGAILSLSVHGARRRRPAVRIRIGIRGEVVRKLSAGRAVSRFCFRSRSPVVKD